MRILHTADWHLGQDLHGHGRTAEHAAFLAWLCGMAADTAPDAMIVAGDVFDGANPSAAATKLFYQTIARLRRALPALDIVVIAGNHDGPRRLELPVSILGDGLDADIGGGVEGPRGRLTIIGAAPRKDGAIDVDAMLAPLTGPDGAIGAICAAIPFLRAGDLGPIAADADAVGSRLSALYADAVAAARRIAPTTPVVLTGHLAVAGASVSPLSERRVSIGGEETVSSAIFPADAAYVALGHLHRAQTAPGATLIRYAGSPFPLSATERSYRHSVSLISLGRGAPKVEEIAAPRPAEFLRAPESGAAPIEDVERLLAALDPPSAAEGLAPYLEVALRLDAPTPDLRARVEAAIGEKAVRLVRIVVERPDDGPAVDAGIDAPLTAVGPEEVFAALHEERYAAPPADPLRGAFATLMAEVAIGDEPLGAEDGGTPPQRTDAA